jgi:hypothetical protein
MREQLAKDEPQEAILFSDTSSEMLVMSTIVEQEALTDLFSTFLGMHPYVRSVIKEALRRAECPH